MSGRRDENERSAEDDPVGRFLLHVAGPALSGLLGGKDGREQFEEGVEQLAGADGASMIEASQAFSEGVWRGLDLVERRRALREYYRENVERGAPPIWDRTDVESREGEQLGVRLVVSEPGVEWYLGEQSVLLEGQHGRTKVPLPFSPGAVEAEEAGEGVSQLLVRPAGYDDAGGGEEEGGEEAAEPDEFAICVYCEAGIEDPAAHHLEEHPDRRFDPAWYTDDDEFEDVDEDEDGDGDAEADVDEEAESPEEAEEPDEEGEEDEE